MSPGERDRGVVLDEGHTTTRSGEVKPDDDADHRDDRMAHDDRMTADDATGDGHAATAEPPLSRDRAIEDERYAGAGADTVDRDRDGDGRADDDRPMDRDRFADGEERTAVAPAPRHLDDAADDRRFTRDGDGDVRTRRHPPILEAAAVETMRERQRERFGGFHWGSDFFGWLCAIGLASLLTAILVGAGVALGISTTDAQTAAQESGTAETIGLGGGIALLLVLAVSWFCGGYVAGRMARFDGARQGLGVWVWTILAAIVVAALAAIGGSELDVFQRLNLPSIAVGDTTLTAGGAITGAIALVVTLLCAVLGGKAGERFHKRVDRVATDEYVVER